MKNITWIFLLTIIWFSNTHCENDFFVTRKNNEYKCITNSSYAMNWITNDNNKLFNQVSVFVSGRSNSNNFFDRKINESNDPSAHQYYFSQEQELWVVKESTDDIVLDRRWEDMKVHITEGTTYYRSRLQFVPLVNITKNNFEIPLSIRTDKEAHMFLCDGEKVQNSNCYWFLLQTGAANATLLRKCPKGSIPSLYKCQVLKAYKMHGRGFELYLTNESWSHYILRKNKNHLTFTQVGRNANVKILEFNETSKIINVKHLFVKSGENNKAFWKIHKLRYLYTNKEIDKKKFGNFINLKKGYVCISIFMKMCVTCHVEFQLLSKLHDVNKTTRFKPEHSGWHEFKFFEKIEKDEYFYLYISTVAKGEEDKNQFWAIDNIRLCQKQEFRVLSINSENENVTCQLISDKTVVEIERPFEDNLGSQCNNALRPNHCPVGTIGQFCVPCKWLYDNCTDIQVYELNKTCEMSYSARNKTKILHGKGKVCKSGTYGSNCTSDCINIDHGNKCYTETSIFVNVSNKNIPEIVIVMRLEIVSTTCTSVTANIQDFIILNKIENYPVIEYLIQYKEVDFASNWTNFRHYKKIDKNKLIEINGLQPKTKYYIRCVFNIKPNTFFTNNNTISVRIKTICETWKSVIFFIFALLFILPVVILILYRRELQNLFQKQKLIQKNNQSTTVQQVYTNPKLKIFSNVIPITIFENYIKDILKNGQFKQQYNMVLAKTSRLTYFEIHGEQFFDYIEMEFVSGQKIPKAYIATEVPKSNTVGDFWKMIWEENVKHIVLLKIQNNCGKADIKYWPEGNEKMEYNNIIIQCVFKNMDEYFERRIFILIHDGEVKNVDQLILEVKIRHGKPLYSKNMLDFFQKTLKYSLNTSSPILVHCSSRLKGTGFFLLCDMCLRTGKEDDSIDVLKNLQKLARHNIHMVRDYEYYNLVHMILLDYFFNIEWLEKEATYVNVS